MVRYNDWRNRVFDYIVIFLLAILGVICLLPLLHVVALSFSSKNAAMAGRVTFWPVEFDTTPYTYMMQDIRFWKAFLVSTERVFLGGTINLVLTILTAYPLSLDKKEFPSRNIYMWVIIFTMLFGGSIVPWYFVIRSTGLIDTIWALVVPGALPVFNMILVMNFFRNEPKPIKEAAIIDGVNQLQMMLKICVPLALPAIATVTLFSVVGHWNNFFDGLLLINTPSKVPLQTYIYTLSNTNIDLSSKISSLTPQQLAALTSQRTFNAAKVIIATLPILILYPFMQRYFVTGITIGSVKE